MNMRIPNLSTPYDMVRSNVPDVVRRDAALAARAVARWENEGGAVRDAASADARFRRAVGCGETPIRSR